MKHILQTAVDKFKLFYVIYFIIRRSIYLFLPSSQVTTTKKQNISIKHTVTTLHIKATITISSANSLTTVRQNNVLNSELPTESLHHSEPSTLSSSTGILLLLIIWEKIAADFLAVLLRSGSLKSTWNRPNFSLKHTKINKRVRNLYIWLCCTHTCY